MKMKIFLIVIILCVGLLGCSQDKKSRAQNSLEVGAISVDVEAVRKAVKEGADVKAKDEHGGTALHATYMLINAINGSGSEEEKKRIPTLVAQAHEIVKILLDAGADPNAKSNAGETPLMSAANTDDEELVFQLIKAGAEINASDKYNNKADYYVERNQGLRLALRDLERAGPPASTPAPTLEATPSKLKERVMEFWSEQKKIHSDK